MDRQTDGQTDRRTDGGDCNIPTLFLKSVGIIMELKICNQSNLLD